MKTPCASTPGRQRQFWDPQKGRALFSRRFRTKIFPGKISWKNLRREIINYFLYFHPAPSAPSEIPIIWNKRATWAKEKGGTRAALPRRSHNPSRAPATTWPRFWFFFFRARARCARARNSLRDLFPAFCFPTNELLRNSNRSTGAATEAVPTNSGVVGKIGARSFQAAPLKPSKEKKSPPRGARPPWTGILMHRHACRLRGFCMPTSSQLKNSEFLVLVLFYFY